MKYPILLPKKSHVTTLILRNTHIMLAHAGRNHVLASLREMYWVIHANAAVRHMIATCITCRKLRKPVAEQKMSDLPPDRCNVAPPFTYTGVDFFGPFTIKQGRKELKRYGALFTCLACRAVHIETSASLDTDSFIHALRIFIARRGPITQLRCDNGTNFVGAERELRNALAELNDDQIHKELLKHNIKWIFNPPAASHMGGSWERQIRTVRKVLAQLSKEFGSMLDDESFRTFMCEIEAIVNSRPITTVSSDPNDMEALTPNHILTMKSRVIVSPPGNFQRADIYMRKGWRRVQYAANIFWTRWKKEYLATLQKRQKWCQPQRNMAEGDIVIIKDDTIQRNYWSMGRIIKTEPDKKGFVRSVIVKTSNSKLRRPIDRLVLLIPIEEQ
jgi:transposase InsO family protein